MQKQSTWPRLDRNVTPINRYSSRTGRRRPYSERMGGGVLSERSKMKGIYICPTYKEKDTCRYLLGLGMEILEAWTT